MAGAHHDEGSCPNHPRFLPPSEKKAPASEKTPEKKPWKPWESVYRFTACDLCKRHGLSVCYPAHH